MKNVYINVIWMDDIWMDDLRYDDKYWFYCILNGIMAWTHKETSTSRPRRRHQTVLRLSKPAIKVSTFSPATWHVLQGLMICSQWYLWWFYGYFS